jgi:Reverse transcriptase (RNA-dependent DNA polymerase)
VEQGVAQGCTLSPILFIIFMNNLLHLLHTHCKSQGIEIGPDGKSYVAHAFADDTTTLADASRQDNMQTILDLMQQHSDWLWDVNVLKSLMMALKTRTHRTQPNYTWKGTNIPWCTEAKSLGLWVSHDMTWTKHLAACRQKGNFALSKHRRLLQNPRLNLQTKVHVIKTRIIPTMRYAMEVWSANTKAEQAGLQDLDHIVDEAMRIAVAGTQAYKWQIRRCLKADVLRELQIPTVEMEMAAAHLRFDDKHRTTMVHACAEQANAHSQQGHPPTQTLTTATRPCLQSIHGKKNQLQHGTPEWTSSQTNTQMMMNKHPHRAKNLYRNDEHGTQQRTMWREHYRMRTERKPTKHIETCHIQQADGIAEKCSMLLLSWTR